MAKCPKGISGTFYLAPKLKIGAGDEGIFAKRYESYARLQVLKATSQITVYRRRQQRGALQKVYQRSSLWKELDIVMLDHCSVTKGQISKQRWLYQSV